MIRAPLCQAFHLTCLNATDLVRSLASYTSNVDRGVYSFDILAECGHLADRAPCEVWQKSK